MVLQMLAGKKAWSNVLNRLLGRATQDGSAPPAARSLDLCELEDRVLLSASPIGIEQLIGADGGGLDGCDDAGFGQPSSDMGDDFLFAAPAPEHDAGLSSAEDAFNTESLSDGFDLAPDTGLVDAVGTEAGPESAVDYATVPLAFEQNQGQTDDRVDFLARGSGYSVFLSEGDAVLRLENGDTAHAIRLDLVGTSDDAAAAGETQLEARSNYLIGSDPDNWLTDMANYGAVRYDDIYEGVDIRYYGNGRQLEYDFIVDPGADASQISLAFDGHESLRIDDNGDLVLTLSGDAGQQVRFLAPYSYQETDTGRDTVASRYVIHDDGSVGFELGDYDTSRTLVIDPILDYGTYLGGTGTDQGHAIAVNDAGNVFVSGLTGSANFPTTTGALDEIQNGGNDVFISKLSPNGSSLVFSTFIGGTGNDEAYDIHVDSTGAVYLTGNTASGDFPTTIGAFDTSLDGSQDAFALKLNAAGNSLVYSTLLGGDGTDSVSGIAVDGTGNAYVTGVTDSANQFPVTGGAVQTSLNGTSDAFVVKLNSAGKNVIYGTYFGGSGAETAGDIAVDSGGRAYVVGSTDSSDLSTSAGAYDRTANGSDDVFLMKLNASGTGLLYSSYLGGASADVGTAIALDGTDNVYITGYTNSGDFSTTKDAYDRSHNGGTDAFIVRLDTGRWGTPSLVFSTFLGGSGNDRGHGVVVDSGGGATIVGQARSNDLPTTADAHDSTLGGLVDAFAATVNSSGATLLYGTYLGGSALDYGEAVAIDGYDHLYITGYTDSNDFDATIGALDTTPNGGDDAFVVKFASTTLHTVVVDTTSDVADGDTSSIAALVAYSGTDGVISLREAIVAANNTLGLDQIHFDIGGGGVQTIQPLASLPTIIGAVVIDGTTQSGYATSPLIELDGSQAGAADGLTISGGGSTVRGLAVNRFNGNGLVLSTAGGNVIEGNHIGTGTGGAELYGNGGVGIVVNNSANNRIGGDTETARNVISDNTGGGIEITGSGATVNLIQGNYIGADSTGTLDRGNHGDGVRIHQGASDNTVGGTILGTRNVISGNDDDGVQIAGSTSTGNSVIGNYIGVNAAGDASLGNTGDGVVIQDAPYNTIGGAANDERNIISGNAGGGVLIFGSNATGNVIAGNYIGLDAAGSVDLGNSGNGITITDQGDGSGPIGGALVNTIGGSEFGAGNVISGNELNGVLLATGANSNVVQGNYVGTNPAATSTLGNTLDGLRIESSSNTIGGLTAQAGNVIGGNLDNGISIRAGSTGNAVRGNYVGTYASGSLNLGNADAGILLTDGSNNAIGGTESGAGNTVAFNQGIGISVELGAQNAIRRNVVYSNTGMGIDLGGDGVTTNDPTDADSGQNRLQNYPEISSATVTASEITINGMLRSAANTPFEIDFFSNSVDDGTGHGEGEVYLGSTSVVTNDSGNASFSASLAGVTVAEGDYVSAIATDPYGNTSEFSLSVGATLADPIIAETGTVPVVDGVVDTLWADIVERDVRNVVAGEITDSDDLAATWTSVWDTDNLYLLVDVTDDVLINDSGPGDPWSDDIVEIFIDADYSGEGTYDGVNDFHFGFRWNDATVYTGPNSVPDTTGITFAIVATAEGYRMEATIPWATLGAAPQSDDFVGMDVQIGDDDDGGARDGKLAWYATSDVSYHDPSAFTAALLGKSDIGTFWLSTASDVASPSGVPGLDSWTNGTVVRFGEPNRHFEPGATNGTFSSALNLDDFADDGDADIDALHYVTREITIGGANGMALFEGDLLISTVDDENLTADDSLSVADEDLFLFRPYALGDYSTGTLTMVLHDLGTLLGIDDLTGISLVQQDTTIGDTDVYTGDFLFSQTGVTAGNDIYVFNTVEVGDGITDGTADLLIEGDDIGINVGIGGLELIEQPVVLGETIFTTQQILVTLTGDDGDVGDTPISVNRRDMFALDVAKTTFVAGIAEAEATLFFEGLDVGLDTDEEGLDALTLITKANKPPDITSSATPSIVENTTDVITIIADDPDDDPVTFTITGGVDAAHFSLGSGTGDLTFDVAPDFQNPTDDDGNNVYEVQVTADDGISGTDVQLILVTVLDGNDPPVITSSGTANVAENTTAVLTVTATDDDIPPQPITFSISGGADRAWFSIDSETGELTFGAAPDFETPADANTDNVYEVQVTADDGDGETDSETIAVTVTGVNETPVNAAPGKQFTSLASPLVFSSANGNPITIGDVDAGSNPMEVTLTATNGTITLAGIGGLSFTTGDGTADATMTFTGAIADVNAALEGMSFELSTGGLATLQIATNDQGNTGSGDPLSDLDTVEITVFGEIANASERLVNTETGDVQETSAQDRGSHAAVALAPDGDSVVVWSSFDQDGDGWGVYGQRYDADGAPLGGEFQVNQQTASDQQWTSVATGLDGGFVAVWTSDAQDGAGDGVYARRYDSGGTPIAGEFLVNTTTALSQSNPSVAMDADGDFVVVWQGNGAGDDEGVYGQRFDSTGTVVGGEFRVNATTAAFQANPCVGMAHDGSFVVVWNDVNEVVGRRYDSSGVPQGGEFTVGNGTTTGDHAVAMDASGNFVVVWKESVIEDAIYARRYDVSGSPLGDSFTVNTTTFGDQGSPSVAMDAAGNFIIAWEGSGPGDGSGIFAQKYDSAGNSIGSEFRVNQTTGGSQHMASLAMLDANNFVSVWSGNGQGDDEGVFVRQFGTAAGPNNAPFNGVPGSQVTNEDTPLVFSLSGDNPLSISDADAADNSVRVTLTATEGAVTLSGDAGLSFSTGDGTYDTTMTFTGTIDDINAALEGMAFEPTSDFSGAASLQIATDDLGNSGSGGPQADTDVVSITVNGVNDDPVIGLPGGPVTYAEHTPPIVIDTSATAVDPDLLDFDTGTLTVDFTAGGTASDRLAIQNQGTGVGQIGISGSDVTYSGVTIGTFAGGTDGSTPLVVTLNANADVVAAEALMRNITYENVSGSPSGHSRVVRYVLSDGDGGTSNSPTTTVNLSTTNDPPQLDLDTNDSSGRSGSDYATTFSEGSGPTAIADTDAVLGDVDSLFLNSMSVTITNVQDGADEVLGADTSGTSIIASYDSGTGQLGLTGVDSLANYDQVLQTITYDNTSQNPDTTGRLISFVANDGIDDSNMATATVSIIAVNDAPSVSVPGAQSTDEDISLVFSSAGGNPVSIGDVDSDPNPVQVTLAATSGTATLSGTSGLSFTSGDGTADATMIFTGQIADINAALDGLAFDSPADYHGPGALQVSVSDLGNTGMGGTLFAFDSVNITVNPVNDAPTATDQSFTVSENSTNGNSVGTVPASDPDVGDTLTYSITGGNTGGAFAIDTGTGEITVANGGALDFETTPTFNLTVQVTDSGSLSDTADVTIDLTDLNDSPTANDASLNLDENSANGTSVGTVIATDPDAGDVLDYSIVGSNTGGAFALNSSTGEITVADSGVLDFEVITSFNLTIVVTDTGSLSDTASVTIDLNDVNESPTVDDASFNIDENSVNGTTVGTVVGSDPDAGDTQTYAISGGNTGGAFAIDNSTGEITVADSGMLDFEVIPTFNLTIELSDSGSLTDTANVTIGVKDVNESPTASDASFGLPENSPNGTSLGTVVATDPDTGDVLTCSITGGNTGGAFAIDSGTGEITVANSGVLDFEVIPTFNLTIQVQDIGGLTDTAAVTVGLTDADEPPDASDMSLNLPENSANGTSVGTVSASDPDLGDALTYSITAGNTSGAFAIDSGTGGITVADSGVLDFEVIQTFGLTIQVEDSTALTDTASVTIDLTELNEEPTANDATFGGVPENSPNGTSIGTVVASDPDTGDTLTYSITGGNTGGAFAIGAGTGEITVAESTAVDFETTPTFNLTVQVQDVGGLTDTAAITINLLDGNDPPVLGDASFVLAENTPNGTAVGTVVGSDPDSGNPVTYSIISGNTGGAFAVDSNTGEISVANSAAVDFETMPTFNLVVQVEDSGGMTGTGNVTIDLIDVNDSPTAGDTTFAIDENSLNGTGVGTVPATDPDAGDMLTYSITGGNTGGAFAIDTGTGEITVANGAVLDFETTPSFALTVEVTDSGGLTDTASVTINVNDVNEGPTAGNASFSLPENSPIGTSVGTVLATDPDAADTLTYSITGGNTGGAFAIDTGTGEITVANGAALDFETTPTFNLTIQVSDSGGLIDTAGVTVNLSDENESPNANDASLSLAENSPNGTAVGTVSASDPDVGDTLTYSITGGNIGGAFAIDTGTGDITVANSAALDFETAPTFNLTIQVEDATSLTDTANVTINLTGVNENPTASDASFGILEHSPNGTSVGTVPATDPDAGDTLTYSIIGGNSAGVFAIDSATGEISVADNTALDFETTPTFNLTVWVQDSAGLTDTADMTINLIDGNDPPTANDSSFVLAENSPNGTPVGTVPASDVNPGDTLTYTIAAGNTDGAFTIDGATGEISVADSTALDFETNPTFNLTIQVQDSGGLTDTSDVTIALTDQNEAPTANDATFSVSEDSENATIVGQADASDTDVGDTLTYSIAGGNTGGAFAVDTGTGEITVANDAALDFDTTPTVTLTIQVADAGGLTDTASVIIDVTDATDELLGPPPTTEPQPEHEPPVEEVLPEEEPPPESPADVEEQGSAQTEAALPTGNANRGDPSDVARDPVSHEETAEHSQIRSVTVWGHESRNSSVLAETGMIGTGTRLTTEPRPGTPTGTHGTTVSHAMVDASQYVSAKMMEDFDKVRDSASYTFAMPGWMAGTALFATTGLSVSYALWLLRGGYILATALTTMPAWAAVDPLPVLQYLSDADASKIRGRNEMEGDLESLESIIRQGRQQA